MLFSPSSLYNLGLRAIFIAECSTKIVNSFIMCNGKHHQIEAIEIHHFVTFSKSMSYNYSKFDVFELCIAVIFAIKQ